MRKVEKEEERARGTREVAVSLPYTSFVKFHLLHSSQNAHIGYREEESRPGESTSQLGQETRGQDEGGNKGCMRVVKENQFTR